MKALIFYILSLSFLIISCDADKHEIEEVVILNTLDKTIFISGIYELETSNLVDPAPTINLRNRHTLVKIDPDESKIFSTDDIIDYHPGADIRIFIYTFGVPEAEDPIVELSIILTVENDELLKSNVIPVLEE